MATTQKQWNITGTTGFDSLKLSEAAPIPEVGENEVLVKLHAASLNYRDLIIPKGKYPFGFNPNVIPCSDGAGIVSQVGRKVTTFQPGDRVITLFNQGHQAGSLDAQTLQTGLGGTLDGTLRQYGVFPATGLVALPSHLNFREGATLTCAGLTAWNALYGLPGRALMPGDVVLTQGTGGVSLFALQFAKAAGARVIATTSSSAKAARLKQLGADLIINYKEDPEWGATAKKWTGGKGVQHVLEVGGPVTMAQSIKAAAIDGVISIIGFLGGGKAENQPTFLDCLMNLVTARGVLVGSRLQFEEMNRAIEANGIHPVVDEKLFKLEEAKEAYEYMEAQKHFGKLCITIDH